MLKIKSLTLPKTIYIGFVDYSKPWKHFKRISDEYIIYIIKTGNLFITIENKNYHLKPNDFILIKKGQLHYGYKASVCSYYYIHFLHNDILTIKNKPTNNKLKELRNYWFSNPVWSTYQDSDCWLYIPIYFNLFNIQNQIFEILEKSINIFIRKKEYYKIHVSCLLNELLVVCSKYYISNCIDKLIKFKTNNYDVIEKLISYFINNYNRKITIEQVEDITNYNYDYINRLFKKLTNYTIMDYLTKLRIDKAKSLAITTSMKCYEIGKSVGYHNQYYFSRVFKKTTGTTLSQYAKTHRRNS